MATTTGKVDSLLVKTENGWVTVDGSLFLLWSGADYAMNQLLWFALCKEAIANDLEVSVDHDAASAIPNSIQLNAPP